MSWTDKLAVKQIRKLKDEFNIKEAVATGTFRGADTELFASIFDRVFSMDIDREVLKIAKERLKDIDNVSLSLMGSAKFIQRFINDYKKDNRTDIVFFWLDAHFYNPDAKKRWVVVDELKQLAGFKNCVIAIHDYDCEGLGHLVYDGEHMGWNVVGEYITKVNPYFTYYCNTKEFTDIINEKTVYDVGITVDENILESVKFVNSSDVKRYRGILYATPEPLDLTKYQLKGFHG